MAVIFTRILFVIISAILGYHCGGIVDSPLIGASAGFVIGGLIVISEVGLKRVSLQGLSSVVFGLILGLIMAKLVGDAFSLTTLKDPFLSLVKVFFTLIFCYLGMIMGLRGRQEFNIIIPYVKLRREDKAEEIVLLDTSVIIDGRIGDIIKTRFLDGRIVVPRFVLRELQQIADSSDGIKRQRGRRGLEVLHKIQKESKIDVAVHEEDFPDTHEVDVKLVKLAKMINAKIMTVDYNLNRVAALQGVKILNINELANSLRMMVFPGESLSIKLIKEGKESNQAVGYLDDGTMVVVEDSRHSLGKEVKVFVTSVLQTPAGRMIFGKMEK